MMKRMQKIISVVVAGVIAVAAAIAPVMRSEAVYAANNCVNTAIINGGKVCDDGKGSGIVQILNIVVNVLTVGVSVLAVIGITVVGTQYLTAGGNEEQTRKAKRRLFEIVIGIVAYILIYALLVWLLPGFNGFNIGS